MYHLYKRTSAVQPTKRKYPVEETISKSAINKTTTTTLCNQDVVQLSNEETNNEEPKPAIAQMKPSVQPENEVHVPSTSGQQKAIVSNSTDSLVQTVIKPPPTVRDYLDRIPIAGMYNYTHATTQKEKRFWIIIFTASVAVTLTYFIPTIITFAQFETVLDVKHYEEEMESQFPPFYACIAGINGTRIRERLGETFLQMLNDSHVLLWIKRLEKHPNPKVRQLYNASDILLSMRILGENIVAYMTSTPLADQSYFNDMPPTQLLDYYIYKAILADGSEWTGIADMYKQVMFPCHSFLRNCTLDGKEFPCCQHGNDGHIVTGNVCFKIDSRSVNRTTSITRQRQISFETQMDTRYLLFKWADLPVVFISMDIPTQFDNIYLTPLESISYVTLKRKRQYKLDDCIPHYHYDPKNHQNIHEALQEYFQNLSRHGEYNVQKCMMAHIFEGIVESCGCVPFYDSIQPNDSAICKPAHLRACVHDEMYQAKPPASVDQIQRDFFQYLKSKTTVCLPLCDSWDYELIVTFASWGRETDIGTGVASGKIVFSLDVEYKVETEVRKMDVGTFLASIGDALGLLLGLTFIGLIQVPYWAIAAAVLVRRKNRRVVATQDATSTL